jgi:hypothetical protein
VGDFNSLSSHNGRQSYLGPGLRVEHNVGFGCELPKAHAIRILDLYADFGSWYHLTDVEDARKSDIW